MILWQPGVENFAKGRGKWKPDVFVIHITDDRKGYGGAKSTYDWFQNPASQVSSHFLVTKKGEIWQFVKIEDQSWGAGRRDRVTAKIVKQRNVNPNLYALNVEFENIGLGEINDAQYEAGGKLISCLANKLGLTISSDRIIGHHSIFFPKPCPSKIDAPRLVALAGSQIVTCENIL